MSESKFVQSLAEIDADVRENGAFGSAGRAMKRFAHKAKQPNSVSYIGGQFEIRPLFQPDLAARLRRLCEGSGSAEGWKDGRWVLKAHRALTIGAIAEEFRLIVDVAAQKAITEAPEREAVAAAYWEAAPTPLDPAHCASCGAPVRGACGGGLCAECAMARAQHVADLGRATEEARAADASHVRVRLPGGQICYRTREHAARCGLQEVK